MGGQEEPLTRIRRIPPHGTDIDQLERYNDLCRTLCRETPDYEAAMERMAQLERARRSNSLAKVILGYFVGAFGFCLFFQGSFWDALCSGLCGVAIGLCMHLMGRLGSNIFFKSIAASAVSAFWPSSYPGWGQDSTPTLLPSVLICLWCPACALPAPCETLWPEIWSPESPKPRRAS